jgi:glycosyltransferase involved in cell wall biosynthesis
VVPYFQLEAYFEDTLRSIAAQTYPRVETIVVNDGSLRDRDALVFEIDPTNTRVVTQVNSGLGAARNFGISQALGRYVLPLDADDRITPEFLERCVHALEHDESLAYVTSWVRYLTEDGEPFEHELAGYMPFGNWSRLIERNNVGGTCASVFRRRVFERGFRYSHDLTSYEDWLLYWEMNRAGLLGGVIPERLFEYRVRNASMMRSVGEPLTGRLYGELKAHIRERTMIWTAKP